MRSPLSVSQHIVTLEKQVGQSLVHQSTRPVELTHAGSVLAEHGDAVLVRLDAARLDLDEIGARRDQRLRMGGFPTALATFVPQALALLHRQHPQVSLVVVDDHVQGFLPRLLRRELDVAVVFDDAAAPSLPNLADELRLTPFSVIPIGCSCPGAIVGHARSGTQRSLIWPGRHGLAAGPRAPGSR
jgi:DNA-binding transcriptional LysR family regulator